MPQTTPERAARWPGWGGEWKDQTWKARWRLFKCHYIPGTWGWGARKLLEKKGLWPK